MRKEIRKIILVSVVILLIASAMALSGGHTDTEEPEDEPKTQEVLIEKTSHVVTEDSTHIMDGVEYTSLIRSYDWSGEDEEILLRIAMAEAEGEGAHGMALVMLVVLNRTLSDDFPNDIESVVFQSGQFEPVSNGRYERVEISEECYEALEIVKSGWDRSFGALYFESCAGDTWQSNNRQLLFKYKNHKFYA